MNWIKQVLKKHFIKYLITNLIFIVLLTIFYVSSNISLLTIGFLFDTIFIIGFISLIYFSIGNNLTKNIIFTILGSLITILFVVDHIYYTIFEKFASITSLNNADLVIDNTEAYKISLDFVAFLMLLVLVELVIFLFRFKNDNLKFKQRVFYSLPAILVLVPFIATYIIAYNDIGKLDIILFPKRYAFPDFIENFGYLIYRYEDIAVVIDNSFGG